MHQVEARLGCNVQTLYEIHRATKVVQPPATSSYHAFSRVVEEAPDWSMQPTSRNIRRHAGAA
jgi:hypothetical protein